MSEYKVSVKIAGQLEKSFNSALQGAQKGLEGLGSLGVKSVQLAAKSLTAAGAAIGAVGVASVNVGREFEAQMSSTAATAGATGTADGGAAGCTTGRSAAGTAGRRMEVQLRKLCYRQVLSGMRITKTGRGRRMDLFLRFSE